MNTLKETIVIAIAIAATTAFAQPERVETRSPDGRLAIALFLEDGAPRYEVAFDGERYVEPSALGFRFRNEEALADGFEIVGVERAERDETWKPVWGEFSEIRDRHRAAVVELRETREPGRTLVVETRAFDDGVAFRLSAPDWNGDGTIEIMDELTEFRFAGDYLSWWIPADFDSYEYLHNVTRLSEVDSAHTPFTMETDEGVCLSVHEAALYDYAGAALEPTGGNAFEVRLAPWPDGAKVKVEGDLQTPWRTIQIAEDAASLLESTLILNLNEPCKLEDVSWIEPMKSIAIFWSNHIGMTDLFMGETHGATTENAKRYIDYAVELGVRGLLIEGWNQGWERWGEPNAFSFTEPYPDFDLEGVVEYARERGVAIIMHNESGGDIAAYDAQIDSAYALYHRLGIKAIKSGYSRHGGVLPDDQWRHGQWMVRNYQRHLEKAAEHKLMINAHEPIKPTGTSRTWPHMTTREGVRGMEYSAWGGGNPPSHTAIIPFTRCLAGPVDYTPGVFDIFFEGYRGDNRIRTTVAKQLSLFVVLFSPIQTAVDLPRNYAGSPAYEFIREVPTTWDETRGLFGKVGAYVGVARRSGEAWFIGALTDEKARAFEVPLDFLDEGARYRTTVYADGDYADWIERPLEVKIWETTVTRADETLTLDVAPGGGAAISIRPIAEGEDAPPRYPERRILFEGAAWSAKNSE